MERAHFGGNSQASVQGTFTLPGRGMTGRMQQGVLWHQNAGWSLRHCVCTCILLMTGCIHHCSGSGRHTRGLQIPIPSIFSYAQSSSVPRQVVSSLWTEGHKALSAWSFQACGTHDQTTPGASILIASVAGHKTDSDVCRIIHQSWVDENVPEEYHMWQQTWKDLHPDWKYILWTDKMNLK